MSVVLQHFANGTCSSCVHYSHACIRTYVSEGVPCVDVGPVLLTQLSPAVLEPLIRALEPGSSGGGCGERPVLQ